MTDVPHQRMKHVLGSLETDPEYCWLRDSRAAIEAQAAAICGELTSEERAVLLEYWGISQEMMLRMVEIACFADEL